MADDSTRTDEVNESAGHDDPSEPPPTSYPTNELAQWNSMDETPQPCVSPPGLAQYPPGVILMPGLAGGGMAPCTWEMGSAVLAGGMVMVPAEVLFKAQHEPDFWSWNPEVWTTADGLDRQSRSHVNEASRKRKPRQALRSRSQSWIGAARQVAERRAALEAEEAKWPMLNGADSTKPRELLPPKSIWRDVVKLDDASARNRDQKEEQKAIPRKESKAVAIEANGCALAVHKTTRDAEVQCELLPPCTDAALVRPHLCTNCGLASNATLPKVTSAGSPTKQLLPELSKESAFEHPELALWGPANDWAWDIDEQCDYSDTWALDITDGVPASATRRFPPAPASPPPSPPPGDPECIKKGGAARRSCPTTPGGSSTTTALRSESNYSTASASNQSPRSPRTPPELPCQMPDMEFVVDSSCLPLASTSQEILQRKLARLRKRCREMERLEERIEQGITLNPDQCSKATRLGSVKHLNAKILRMESRIVRASEGIPVSDSESDEEDDELQISRRTNSDAISASDLSMRSGISIAAEISEPLDQKLEDISPASQHQQSTASGSQSCHKGKRLAKLRTPLPNLQSAERADLGLRQPAKHSTKLHAESTRLAKRKAFPRLATSLRLVASRLRSCLVILLAALLVGMYSWMNSGKVENKNGVFSAVNMPLLTAGSSNVWIAVAPRDADLNSKSQSIQALVRAEEVEIARASAIVRQMKTNVDTIRSKLRKEERDRHRTSRKLQKESELAHQSEEEKLKQKQLQMQRWWARQDEQRAMQTYHLQQQQWHQMQMDYVRNIHQGREGSMSSGEDLYRAQQHHMLRMQQQQPRVQENQMHTSSRNLE